MYSLSVSFSLLSLYWHSFSPSFSLFSLSVSHSLTHSGKDLDISEDFLSPSLFFSPLFPLFSLYVSLSLSLPSSHINTQKTWTSADTIIASRHLLLYYTLHNYFTTLHFLLHPPGHQQTP